MLSAHFWSDGIFRLVPLGLRQVFNAVGGARTNLGSIR